MITHHLGCFVFAIAFGIGVLLGLFAALDQLADKYGERVYAITIILVLLSAWAIMAGQVI